MLSAFRSIRPDERRDTFGAAATLFFVLAAHALLETARDTLFLSSIPAEKLPLVYLGIAVVSLVVHRAQQALLRGRATAAGLSATLGAAGGITMGFWYIAGQAEHWALYALYVWSGVLVTIVLLHFWTMLGSRLTIRQAQRVYAVVGTGSVAGAIAGSAAARGLLEIASPRSLVLIAGGVLLAVAALPVLTLRARAAAPRAPGEGNGAERLAGAFRQVVRHPYALRMVALTLATTATTTLADWVFKSAAAAQFSDPVELGEFFATVYLAVNVVSLAVQVLLVQAAVRRLGVTGAMAVLPAVLGFAGLGVALGASGAALLLKLGDGSLRHSLHRTALELLYVPLDEDLRARLKALVDVAAQRGGQALASIGILGAVAMGSEAVDFGAVLVISAALWAGLALEMKASYFEHQRGSLRHAFADDAPALPDLDLASFESLMATLNSPSENEVLASIEVLAEERRSHLLPSLLLYHPSDEVVRRVAAEFARTGRTDFIELADRRIDQVAPLVRGALLRARHRVQPDRALLEQGLSEACPVQRMTSLVFLVSHGWMPVEEAAESVAQMVATGPVEGRVALAEAVAFTGASSFAWALVEMLDAAELDVRFAAADALAAAVDMNVLGALIERVADRQLRRAIATAIVALGSEALEPVLAALDDVTTPTAVRWQLPSVVARLAPRAGGQLLLDRLVREADGMTRFKILRQLERLRDADPDVPLDAATLRHALEGELRDAWQLMAWEQALARDADDLPEQARPVHGLLVRMLADKGAHAVDRMLGFVSLLYPDPSSATIRRGLRAAGADTRAASVELLEQLVSPELRDPISGLVDDLSHDERLRRARAWGARVPHTYEAALGALMTWNSEVLQTLAARQAADLGATALRPRVEAIPRRDAGSALNAVIDEAVRSLRGEDPLPARAP